MRDHIRRRERGGTLIEVLVAVALFLLGVVGVVSAMGVVVSNQADVQIRSEAAMRAESMLNTMWLNVDRATPAATTLSLQTFAHRTGTEQACNFAGDASSNNLVTAWVSDLTSGAGQLPGSTPAMQQILVDTTANNQVTITLCWQSSGDAAPRQYVLRSYVN